VAPELLPVPPSRGGAIERWVRDAAGRLAGRGHDVHVVSRDHGDGARERTVDGVHYHFVRIPVMLEGGLSAALLRGLWYYAGVRRRLARIAPDIVHHHSRPSGLWLSLNSATAARHVISLHSMEYGWSFGYRGWERYLMGRGLRAAARVLCVSEFIRGHALERDPALRGKTTTLYNGVDGETFRPASDEALPPGSPRILYVGRIEERKGVHVLLDAFERIIAPQRPDALLRIVGPHSYWDAEPSAYYREIAARCAVNPRVELRGPTYVDAELAALYRDALVAVVPSVFPEALGLTSLEAQASGVPVVVSDSGGLPETVSAGESGAVFERGSVDGLARAVLHVLADEPRRRTMAAAARTWAMARFSWDAIAGQLEDVYAEALSAPGAAA
jgi:glycosyltransferase involved in cell wall biosynthesis